MTDWKMHAPVVFIIFNRPDTTRQVFEAIRHVQPPKLLVVADGPRAECEGEAEKCATTRAIIEQVDWDCEVLTEYSETNLGCKRRVASGLKWAFEQVEEAIILEDDCLPHPTFFRFAEELLEKYRDDQRIVAISGFNPQPGNDNTQYSYYFSRYSMIWGWATWRRSVELYNPDIDLWPEIRNEGWLEELFELKTEKKYWHNIFEGVYSQKIDTWDYSWFFMSLIQNRFTISPNVNLVSNIGFSKDATHTLYSDHHLANLPTSEMKFPLKHPLFVIRNNKADRLTRDVFFNIGPFQNRVIRKIKKIRNRYFSVGG